MSPSSLFVGLAVLLGVIVLRTLVLRAKRISKEELMDLLQQGTQVVDVRTPQEFAQAHAAGSRNIPLDQLMARTAELDRNHPIVVCCASGARSSMAKRLLERAGFTGVHNAGPWQSVR